MGSTAPIGVIAGSGFEPLFEYGARSRETTPFGRFDYLHSSRGGVELIVVPRHGIDHSIPPQRLPSRAHMLGLARMGVRKVMALSAVGSAQPRFGVGDVVVVDQLIDMTTSRPTTFYDDHVVRSDMPVVHTDMSVPLCPHLAEVCRDAAGLVDGWTVHGGGVYTCTEGPRYETPAEVEMIARLGGDVIGHSAAGEVTFARELGLCYSLTTMVSNLAAGRQMRVESRDILDVVWESGSLLGRFLDEAIPRAGACERSAPCTDNDLEATRLLGLLDDGRARGAQ